MPHHKSPPSLTAPTKILVRREMAAILVDLTRKAARSPNTRLNLIIFRLACCGLRASEIAALRIADVRPEVARPHLAIRVGKEVEPEQFRCGGTLERWKTSTLGKQRGLRNPRKPSETSLSDRCARDVWERRFHATRCGSASGQPARSWERRAWKR